MSHATTTTALTISLVSIVVVLWIDALTPGAAGADIEKPAQTSITSAPVVREPAPNAHEPKRTAIHAETREQHDIAEWALGRFEEAGLELPPLDIYLHSDREGCNGLFGFHSITDAGDQAVHSCGTVFTLLHELGHAWDHHQLDDETRDRFLEKAQAETWHADEWLLSGSEHAANVIAWGLVNERINQTRTRPYDYTSMLGAFNLLTGGEPLWIDG